MNKKQTIRLNESQLRQIVKESVKRVLKERREPKFYVAADVNSDYFDTYEEAYDYASKLAENESDWFEPILIMDYQNWKTITVFDEDGITDLRS